MSYESAENEANVCAWESVGRHQKEEAAWRWYGIRPIATEVERKIFEHQKILPPLIIQDDLLRNELCTFPSLQLFQCVCSDFGFVIIE